MKDIIDEDDNSVVIGSFDPESHYMIPHMYLEIDEDETDTSIPHVHIRDSKNDECDIPVCLSTANFFSHNGQFKELITKSEIEEIVDKFNEESELDNSKSVWEYTVHMWNVCYPENQVQENISIPNYSEDMEWI